jgi:flagellar basal-body rod protein FlgF
MDRLIYTAMTGASHILKRQDAVTQNLSNSNTTGYRSSTNAFRAVPLVGEGLPTRTFVVDSVTGFDSTPASFEPTGRQLDAAVDGKGWFAVKLPDGSEAYTRDGSFMVSPTGVLQTRNGLTVVGSAGPITIPSNTEVSIGQDGTISTVPTGDIPSQVAKIGRIKLVNPPDTQMVRGDDGMFHTTSGKPAEANANVMVVGGNLEHSNVNVVESMVDMIALARQFDMQMSMLKHSQQNDQQAEQILTVS